jgi:hypothetical protein
MNIRKGKPGPLATLLTNAIQEEIEIRNCECCQYGIMVTNDKKIGHRQLIPKAPVVTGY